MTINVHHHNRIHVRHPIDRWDPGRGDVNWSHRPDRRRDIPYRGGDRTRDQLQRRADRVDREQFRGRDVDRSRAEQALRDRGVSTDRDALRDRNRDALRRQAQGLDPGRSRELDRGAARDRAQSIDRDAARDRAQNIDRDAARDRARDMDRGGARDQCVPALQGVDHRQARQEIDRGRESRESIQRPAGTPTQRPRSAEARPAQGQRPSGALFAVAPVAFAQQAFPTPLAAAEALVDGVARHDDDAIARTLGKDHAKYLPVPRTSSEDVTTFLASWAEARRIVPAGDAKAWLEVGRYGWTLPIPIVKGASGWSFDVSAMADELRTRRIGRNELDAIQVMRAYVDAQDEYKAGEGRGRYATRLVAAPGKRDGLYWPSQVGTPPSPLGPYVAKGVPYGGYRFRQLPATDAAAAGARPVFVGWPEKWDDTGVKTFVVDRDGVVRQKDLGPESAARVRAMSAYAPDASWQKVD